MTQMQEYVKPDENPTMYRVGWYEDGDCKIWNSELTYSPSKANALAEREKKQGKTNVSVCYMDENGDWREHIEKDSGN